jgi:hypothetical protein
VRFGDPKIADETLEQIDTLSILPGDVVGIGIHTGNALRGYEVGRLAREKGAWVIFDGIDATLYPEAFELRGAHSVVKRAARRWLSSGKAAMLPVKLPMLLDKKMLNGI